MNMYKFEDIKSACSCIDIARDLLGLEINGFGRGQAVWRGGNGFNVAYNEDGWFDHAAAEKGAVESGSVLDLVMIVGNHDMLTASSILGDHLGIAPIAGKKLPGNSRYDKLIEEGYFEVARYLYTDPEGNPAHHSARLEHSVKGKTFCQGVGRKWSLGDTKLYPYNLPAVIASPYVFVVEGEKAATALIENGCVATTNVAGAGKWKDEYSEYLIGKQIIILQDNDEKGKDHAKMVAKSTMAKAEVVKILTTSTIPKGDVVDWFVEGHTVQELFTMATTAPKVTEDDLADFDEMVMHAKEANRFAFRNFKMEGGINEKTGKPENKKVPRFIDHLVEDVHKRLLNFPCKIGESLLFDHDRDNNEIYQIDKPSKLTSWMSSKMGSNIEWFNGGIGFSCREELMDRLFASARRYESVSLVPHWPVREDVFYAHEKLPPPSPTHEYFNGFIDFFNPTSEIFKTIMKAFVIAPMFYRDGVQRPVWVIDSEVRGSGKTTLAEMVSTLYGAGVIDIKPKQLEQKYDELMKNIISPSGRESRIALVDNISGYWKSDTFSSLTTKKDISGRRSYGKGHESRPNDLTYIVTGNSPSFDDDIVSRMYYFKLKRLDYEAGWVEMVNNYIKKNQLHIFADILDILNNFNPTGYAGITPLTRCGDFECNILRAVCKDVNEYNDVIKQVQMEKQKSNADFDNAKELEDTIRHELIELGIAAESNVWIRSSVIKRMFSETLSDKKAYRQIIEGYVSDGHAQFINCDTDYYPPTGSERRRGILWAANPSTKAVEFVAFDKGKKLTFSPA